MIPKQRRMLWAGILAMTYIFWYEASGTPLIWLLNAPDPARLKEHFWEQSGCGAAFLSLGILLTWTVPVRSKEGHRLPVQPWEWVTLAMALGALAGTYYRSWAAVFG